MFAYPLGADESIHCADDFVSSTFDSPTKAAIANKGGESETQMMFYGSPVQVEQSCGILTGGSNPIPADLGNFEYTCVANPDLCADNGMTWAMWIYLPSSRSSGWYTKYLVSCHGNGRGVRLTQIANQTPIMYQWFVQYSSTTLTAEFALDPVSTWIHLGMSYNSQGLKVSMQFVVVCGCVSVDIIMIIYTFSKPRSARF